MELDCERDRRRRRLTLLLVVSGDKGTKEKKCEVPGEGGRTDEEADEQEAEDIEPTDLRQEEIVKLRFLMTKTRHGNQSSLQICT